VTDIRQRPAGGGNRGAVPSPFPEISSLGILLAVPPDADGDALARELSRTRASVRRLWPLPPQLAANVDVMFCELVPELAQCLPWVPGQPAAALVGVTSAVQPPPLKLLRDCVPHAVLHRPFTATTVLTSLAMARAQFLYEQRLRTRIDKLDETLRAFRSVERAKQILMEQRDLDEEEAYHFMRRQAMNRRISIGAVAAAIIDSHGVLG
jgi:two-component system, response regulator / RNA-binding antiterminator